MTATRVILVDTHHVVRAALRSLLTANGGITVVGDVGDGHKGLDLVAKLQPQLVVLEIALPGLGGVETTRRIVREFPGVRALILSTLVDEAYVLGALRAGASGYVYKGSQPRELELAIESVASGEIFLSPIISKHVIEAYLSRSADEKTAIEILTLRQREILQLVA